MGPRVLRQPSVSIALIVLAVAGCAFEPPPPVTMPTPAAASSEELRWAVEASLAARNWTVLERKSGAITAFVYSQGTASQAVVEITYRPGVIEIACVKEDVSRSRYDRWIQLLSAEIRKNTALLGMGRAPAPLPPPAAR